MKRLIFLLLLIVTALGAEAKPPRLACEKLFSYSRNGKSGYEFVTKKNEESYFRRITATDKKLLAEARKLIDADSKRADNMVSGYEENSRRHYIILNISNNNRWINIGLFWWNDSGFMELFVEGPMDAFR